MPTDSLTRFVARLVPRHRIDALCFGTPVSSDHNRGGGCIVHAFRPGQLFAVIWWRWQSDDRQHRALAIVQAITADMSGHRLPGIQKPVAVLAMVDQHGPPGQDGAVDQILDRIEDLRFGGMRPEQLLSADWTRFAQLALLDSARFDMPRRQRIGCVA